MNSWARLPEGRELLEFGPVLVKAEEVLEGVAVRLESSFSISEP